jgi:hypothetical protein
MILKHSNVKKKLNNRDEGELFEDATIEERTTRVKA